MAPAAAHEDCDNQWFCLSRFANLVPRERMGSLLQTLRAVPPARLAAMQAALRDAWPRFAYLGLVVREHARQRRGRQQPGGGSGVVRGRGRSSVPPVAQLAPLVEKDAVATLLQALHARLPRRQALLCNALQLLGLA